MADDPIKKCLDKANAAWVDLLQIHEIMKSMTSGKFGISVDEPTQTLNADMYGHRIAITYELRFDNQLRYHLHYQSMLVDRIARTPVLGGRTGTARVDVNRRVFLGELTKPLGFNDAEVPLMLIRHLLHAPIAGFLQTPPHQD